MLKNLYIHNYAIIDELSIEFSSQLNVITGETGAGKSILMGALSLILGDRADTSVLLNREKKCIVEGTFVPANNTPVLQLLEAYDLQNEDEATSDIVIRREISANGKSRAFVNDIPVNLDQLKQVSSQLVDLHRQFDTLSLSDSGFQRNVLDALASNASILQQYQLVFRKWKAAEMELDNLRAQKNAFNKEYDYHKFLFDELEEAGFLENELEDAEAELKLLNNAEAIKTTLAQADDSLSGGEQPVAQQMKVIQHQLDAFASVHPRMDEISKRLHSLQIELQDIAEELTRLNDEISFDASRVEELNERLSTGYKLMKKHGVKSTTELLALKDELEQKLQAVLNIDERIAEKEKEAGRSSRDAAALADTLSDNRNKQVKPLQDKVNKLLVQVGMPNARIKVSIELVALDVYGRDRVEFLFDANKSNRFEPIRKVASGGELSRLMLSIKSLVAESMDMPTLIFDEIDTGISGEAARQVGIIMHSLAAQRQLITITHQPQIAGKAHAHLFVYKDMQGDIVRTSIRHLDRNERITTIAKMLSGEKPTAAALENAREMVAN